MFCSKVHDFHPWNLHGTKQAAEPPGQEAAGFAATCMVFSKLHGL
jgi:hypothetical protein